MEMIIFSLVVLIMEATCETAEQYKELILKKHNGYRREQGGSNINKLCSNEDLTSTSDFGTDTVEPAASILIYINTLQAANALVWSDALAEKADAWISRCDFKHQNEGYGENLAMNTGANEETNIEEAFSQWYGEKDQYNYAATSCGSSCHYTQLVWYNTREVGCATTRCPSLNMNGRPVRDAWYFGCWYDPAGNDRGEFPFLKGVPCTACLEGQTCEDSLCAGRGREKCEDKNEDCSMWEASGSCESNKKFMEKNSKMSCGLCTGGEKGPCKDKNADCTVFKPTCETNKSWMKPNCAKTCGFC